MDTNRHMGNSSTAFPDSEVLGLGASRLYDELVAREQAMEDTGTLKATEIADIMLACCDEENDGFTNYAAWPCESIGLKRVVDAKTFLSLLSKHGRPGIEVPVARLVRHAKVLSDLDCAPVVENRHVNRVLCAYYSSFDSRFQALFYPSSYSRFASSEAASFEFSSFLAELVRRLCISHMNMNSLWVGLNMEGWKAASLLRDFFERIGEEPRATQLQSGLGTENDVLDEVVRGTITVEEYMRKAAMSIMPSTSHLCRDLCATDEVQEAVFNAIGYECPQPASVEDIVDVVFENLVGQTQQGGDFEGMSHYAHIQRQWNEYCRTIARAYESLKAHGGDKGRTMPMVRTSDDAVVLVSDILASGASTVEEAMKAMGYEDPQHRSGSLMGALPLDGDVEFVRMLIAFAACFKGRYVDGDLVEVKAEDILFAYRVLSERTPIDPDREGTELAGEAWESFLSFVEPNDFGVPEYALYRMSNHGTTIIDAQAVFDTATELDGDDAVIQIPLDETDYSIEQSALPLFAGTYIVKERNCLGHRQRTSKQQMPSSYNESLLIMCALAATQSSDEAVKASDIFFATLHEPPFDVTRVRLRSADEARKRAMLEALPVPAPLVSPPVRKVRTAKHPDPGETPNLDRYCDDLTAQVHEGLGDGIVGREDVIAKIETVLLRKDKSNPVLLAPAGSGKTAIVEGLAKAIAEGRSQAPGKRVAALNIGSLVDNGANANVVAERISAIVSEAISTNTILFIDEIHMITSIGQRDFDVANMLKPYLARSGLKVIGATTEKEYNATICKDRALDRRFDAVRVPAMDFNGVIQVLEAKQGMYGSYHGVVYDKPTLKTIALMAQDYMSARTSPDRELDVLDMSAAIAQKEDSRVVEERHIVDAVKILTSNDNVASRRQLAHEAQMGVLADNEAFAEIAGQEKAKEAIANRLAESRISFTSSKRPANVMMFAGDSGVGKTYMAHQMAKLMNLEEDDILEIALGDYQTKGSHTTLIGAPPSYVGYDDGGVLVNFATAHPGGIVILDEIDKCASEIRAMFLGIFDTGILRAANGLVVDCSSMTFICTANTGYDAGKKHVVGFGCASALDIEKENALESIKETFGAPLVSRMDEIVLFDTLGVKELEDVCRINYGKIAKDVENRYDMKLEEIIGVDEVIEQNRELICANDTDARMVGRRCDAIISDAIFKRLSEIK